MREPKVELWQAGNGRWYYRRVAANGRVTETNSVASRRSARRSIHKSWPGIRIVVLPV